MPTALRELEVGLMFWGDTDPLKMIRAVKTLGIRNGHLGFTGDIPLAGLGEAYKKALADEDFVVTAVFAAYEGESYADIPTVLHTVGFVPDRFREAREQRTFEVINTAAEMGVPIFACHVGFVPEDIEDTTYVYVRNLVRRVADHCARYGMTFALETGQEHPEALQKFLADVDRPNVKLNFDPANLVLYGTAEPIPALQLLAKDVVSIHVKDGNWPPPGQEGALGTEMPLGQGQVNIAKFVETLKAIGFTGPLTIEREVSLEQDLDDRHQAKLAHVDDIKAAIALLESLR